MLKNGSLKERIKKGDIVFGLYVNLIDPAIAEIAYYAGFDFIRIDCEHMLYDYSSVANIIRTASNIGLPAFVRVSDTSDITRLLDFGASGIIIPHVSNREKAVEAVNLSKFAPLGERGMFSASRARRYGTEELTGFMDRANKEISVVIQIEDREALENIDEILSVEGIDMLATGKGDLSQSLGVSGQPNHKKVLEAEERVIQKAIEYGKMPTIIARTPERAAELIEKGVFCISVGPDTSLLLKGLEGYLSNMRKAQQ